MPTDSDMEAASGNPYAGGLRRRVLRNLGWLASGSVAGALLSMLAVAINSRALTITDFGTLVLLQSAALLLAGVFTFATQQPVIKLGIGALEAGDRDRFERLIGLGLVADALSAACAGAVGVAAVLALPATIGLPMDRIAPALIVAASLLFQGYKTSEGVFRAFDRFDVLGVIQVAIAVLQLAAAALLWILDAPFVFYGMLAAGIIALPSLVQLAAAMLLLRARGYSPSFRGVAKNDETRREFIAYCWTTSATGTCDTIRSNGDSTLVGLIVSVEAAGIYNVAKQVAGIVRKATVIYASVLFPELASMAAQGRLDQARRVLRRAALASVAIATVVALGAAVAGEFALGFVFGPAFAAGAFALVLLSGAAGLQLLSATYSMYLQVFVGPVALLRAYLVATLAFLVLIVLALPELGIAGAGWAQLGFAVVLAAACRAQLGQRRALGERSA